VEVASPMSMTDIVELLKKTKVSKDFPIEIELLKKGFIESIRRWD